MSPTGLTCEELVKLVTDYLEGAMPPAECQRFEMHLDECEGCRAYLTQMRQTITLTGRLTETHLSPAARAELLQLFRDWKK